VTIPPAALNDMSLLCDLFRRHRCSAHICSSHRVCFFLTHLPSPQNHLARVRSAYLLRLCRFHGSKRLLVQPFAPARVVLHRRPLSNFARSCCCQAPTESTVLQLVRSN
jgi:hypothetical protein